MVDPRIFNSGPGTLEEPPLGGMDPQLLEGRPETDEGAAVE